MVLDLVLVLVLYVHIKELGRGQSGCLGPDIMQSCAALLIHSDTGSGFYKNTTWLERLDRDNKTGALLFIPP